MQEKNVINRVTGFFICIFLLAMLAGCSLNSATPIHYEPQTSPNKTCTLNISSTLTVRYIDGQSIHWTADAGDMWAQVQIPEGSHTLILDYGRMAKAGSIASYKANGIIIRYDRFIAGHTYLLASQPVGYSSIKIGIKDVTNEPDWGSFSKAINWTDGFEWLPHE